jgi:hypothetical protein
MSSDDRFENFVDDVYRDYYDDRLCRCEQEDKRFVDHHDYNHCKHNPEDITQFYAERVRHVVIGGCGG